MVVNDNSDRGVDSEAGCIAAMRREDERVDQAVDAGACEIKIWTGVRLSHR